MARTSMRSIIAAVVLFVFAASGSRAIQLTSVPSLLHVRQLQEDRIFASLNYHPCQEWGEDDDAEDESFFEDFAPVTRVVLTNWTTWRDALDGQIQPDEEEHDRIFPAYCNPKEDESDVEESPEEFEVEESESPLKMVVNPQNFVHGQAGGFATCFHASRLVGGDLPVVIKQSRLGASAGGTPLTGKFNAWAAAAVSEFLWGQEALRRGFGLHQNLVLVFDAFTDIPGGLRFPFPPMEETAPSLSGRNRIVRNVVDLIMPEVQRGSVVEYERAGLRLLVGSPDELKTVTLRSLVDGADFAETGDCTGDIQCALARVVFQTLAGAVAMHEEIAQFGFRSGGDEDINGALFSENLVHGDLKPENIFFGKTVTDEPGMLNAKIADFGGARLPEMAEQACTTPAFFAPELIVKMIQTRTIDEVSGKFNYKVPKVFTKTADMFALGLTFSALLGISLPYNANDLHNPNRNHGFWQNPRLSDYFDLSFKGLEDSDNHKSEEARSALTEQGQGLFDDRVFFAQHAIETLDRQSPGRAKFLQTIFHEMNECASPANLIRNLQNTQTETSTEDEKTCYHQTFVHFLLGGDSPRDVLPGSRTADRSGGLLNGNPAKRFTAREALQHAWVRKHARGLAHDKTRGAFAYHPEGGSFGETQVWSAESLVVVAPEVSVESLVAPVGPSSLSSPRSSVSDSEVGGA